MTPSGPRPRSLRVLFLTGFPAIGGPLPKLAPLIEEGLRREGCEVKIEGWSAHSAAPESVAVKISDRSKDLSQVRTSVRRWRPDVVYVATTHNWPALMRDVPLALALPRRLPLVLHFHGSECGDLGRPGHGAFTALSRWLVNHAAAVLLLSREEYGTWTRVCPRARFEIVANPYVPSSSGPHVQSPATGVRTRPPTLLFVGRLVREKGIFELMDAISIVRRRRACRLVIAGAGPAEGEVRRRMALMGLDDDVDLRGYVAGDELDRTYRDADIFVLPSYREGFPLVVMEAMDVGLPVVTTPLRGCADHLAPNVNALFAPPRDAEALAEALLRLMGDGALRERMSAANRAKVLEFAPDVVLPRYLAILRSVVDGRRVGVP